jgi:hypothetical protein
MKSSIYVILAIKPRETNYFLLKWGWQKYLEINIQNSIFDGRIGCVGVGVIKTWLKGLLSTGCVHQTTFLKVNFSILKHFIWNYKSIYFSYYHVKKTNTMIMSPPHYQGQRGMFLASTKKSLRFFLSNHQPTLKDL